MEDVPQGLMAHELLRDLRFIKLSPRDRTRVLFLRDEFKVRHLSPGEETELRVIYRKHTVALDQLRAAEERAKVSITKEKRGHKHVTAKLKEASVVGAERNREELQKLTAEIHQLDLEEKDFGF